MHNISQILHPYYVNSEYESLFVGNFVNIVESFDGVKWSSTMWNPLKLRTYSEEYKIYCTLGWILRTVEALLAKNNVTTISYYITLYLDMYIPLVIYIEDSLQGSNEHLLTERPDLKWQVSEESEWDETKAPVQRFMPDIRHVFHEGNLPNVLHHIVKCSFFSDTRTKSNPIVHLISKALPHRCTIRNLRDITSNYCRKYDDVYQFVFGCLKCSLLGLYEKCIERPSLKTRIVLIRKFNNVSKGAMLKWMMKDHQQLLFYVIKEFLIYGVRQIPALYMEIKERYYWDKFEHCVETAMNNVRRGLFEHGSDDIMDFKDVEPQLSSMNKQQVHHLYRPTKHTFAKILLLECDKLDEMNAVDFITKEFTKENKDLMYNMSIRTSLEMPMPFQWLEFFRIAKVVIKDLEQIQEVYVMEGSRGSLKALLSGLDRYSFECIRTFAEIWDRKMNVRIFTLPKHIYIQQCKALRRKYNIENGQPLPPNVGNTLLCMECKQFKGFTNKCDVKQKGNISQKVYKNLFGLGNKKVLVDDISMKLYCGKRCDKVDGKKRHHYVPEYSSYMTVENKEITKQNNDRARRRAAKERRKEFKNDICSQTELTCVDLTGNILQFYGEMYTVCPKCANFMTFESKHFTKDGFYCGCCIQHGKLYTDISCEYCHAVRGNETWSPITVYKEGKLGLIYLCQSCHKNWIKSATEPLDVATIKRGLHNKWKRLQHPSNV